MDECHSSSAAAFSSQLLLHRCCGYTQTIFLQVPPLHLAWETWTPPTPHPNGEHMQIHVTPCVTDSIACEICAACSAIREVRDVQGFCGAVSTMCSGL
mmetsp:Transcript_37398/g.73328  ORF Transcript_37398/g.73328 Transcript_37398/m.73328 type:complete len:98 (+) Transcript_37398:769-1062(+)